MASYYVGSKEGTFHLEKVPSLESGTKSMRTTMQNGQKLMTYSFCMVIDSIHFKVPDGYMIANSDTICRMEGFWIATDTLTWNDSMPDDKGDRVNCKHTDTDLPEFKWGAGVEPQVTVILGKKGTVGDTLHLTIISNFPAKKILSRMRLTNLAIHTIQNSTAKTMRHEDKTTAWFYSETIVVKPTFPGEASFERLEFEYLGRKIVIPRVKVKVKK